MYSSVIIMRVWHDRRLYPFLKYRSGIFLPFPMVLEILHLTQIQLGEITPKKTPNFQSLYLAPK